nr:hypothetical protein [uncultured Treponema sp.]
MTEEELKGINAPDKTQISPKKRKINTSVFTVVMTILNLVYTVCLVFLIMLGCLWVVNEYKIGMSSEDAIATTSNIVLWVSVISGIVLGFFLSKLLNRLFIKLFKLEDKLEKSYVDRVFGRDKLTW